MSTITNTLSDMAAGRTRKALRERAERPPAPSAFRRVPGVAVDPYGSPEHPNGLHAYELEGRILRLPHVDVVPVRMERNHTYTCVVVGSRNASYPVGGYHLSITDHDLLGAEVLDVGGVIA